jgi:hypothetical protein
MSNTTTSTAAISDVYINALLADAAYVEEDERFKDNLEKRMTPLQSDFILENFEILSRCESGDCRFWF